MINTRLIGYNGNIAKVGHEGEVSVVVHPHPPQSEEISPLPFSQFLTDDGTSDGSNDMRANGSSINQEFYISTKGEKDIYIKSLSIQISDIGARLDRFGALAPLTNGVQIYYDEVEIGQLIISEAIQTNLDFFRDSAPASRGFGSGSSSWLADISGSGEDTYFPYIDFSENFGLQWGLRLVKGTTDRIVFNIRDNLSTGLSVFNVKAYGITI